MDLGGANEQNPWIDFTLHGTSGYSGGGPQYSTGRTAPGSHEVSRCPSQTQTAMETTPPFMSTSPFYPNNTDQYPVAQNASSWMYGGFYASTHPQNFTSSAAHFPGHIPGGYACGSSTAIQDTFCGGYQTEYDFTTSLYPPQELPFSNGSTPIFSSQAEPPQFAVGPYPGEDYDYMTGNTPYLPYPAQPTVQAPWPDSYVLGGQAPGYRRRNVAVPCTQARQLPAGQRECPFCDYTQKGRRAQDLRRHIATHTRSTDVLWSCCGVPREDAAQHKVPDAVLLATDAPMVGGCGQPFSRRDALQRHLRERKERCFGDASANWHTGNLI